MSPEKLDPNKQPSKHAQKNICMTLEKMAYHFQMVEKYIAKVVEPNIAAESFDDLRYVLMQPEKQLFLN